MDVVAINGTGYTDVTNGGGYSGATTNTLNINTVGNFGAGIYRARVSGPGLSNTYTAAATVVVNATPTAPTTTAASRCDAGSLTLTASGGTNGQYRWYTTTTGGTAIGGEANSTFTTPSLITSNTYYVSINNGTCESTRTPVVATVNALPPNPVVSNISICSGLPATLTASGGVDGQYRWYTALTGGTAIAGEVNSTFTTPALTTSTTYYVANNSGACEGSRTPAVVTVNLSPSSPTVNNVSVCSGLTATLTASGGAAGQYRWYTVPTGGTAISGEVSSSITTPTLTTSTTYYVSIDNGTCESPRTPVVVTVNPVPSNPTVSNVSVCSGLPAILTASGGGSGQYRWYTSATALSAIAGEVNASFVTPPLTANTSYYVSLNNGACESVRVLINVNVFASPNVSVEVEDAACSTNDGRAQAIVSGGTPPNNYSWLPNTATASSIENVAAGDYTLIVTDNNKCSQSLPFTVLAPPSVMMLNVTSSGESYGLRNGTAEVAVEGGNFPYQYVWAPGGAQTARAEGLEQGAYVIQVTDAKGCVVRDTAQVEEIPPVVIPNAFTPNGDAVNDLWEIAYIENYPSNSVTIFNRWG